MRILTVDDSDVVRLQVKDALSPHGDVVEAATAREAMAVANDPTQVFDLILLDIHLPGADGLEILRRMRQIERYKTTTVVVLTTESSTALMLRGKELAVLAWIIKPFNPKKLVTLLKMIQDNKGPLAVG